MSGYFYTQFAARFSLNVTWKMICPLGLIAILFAGCQSRKLDLKSATRAGSDERVQDFGDLPPYSDFCFLNKQERNLSGNIGSFPDFWSRQDIEENIESWKALVKDSNKENIKAEFLAQRPAESPYKASVILTAYATAYKEMTAERDRERCKAPRLPGVSANDPNTSPMVADGSTADGRLVNMINHALADLMTRNIVNISKGCLLQSEKAPGYNSQPENERWEFCDLYFDTVSDKFRNSYNSLTVAMSSTMIYLTSHISGSLAALPFLDRLWVGSRFALPAGGNIAQEKRAAIWNARIEFIAAQYKDTFDQFNSFLAQNIDTVADALAADEQIKSTSVPNLAKTIEIKAPALKRFIGNIFEVVRTESFDIGLGMASALASDSLARKAVSDSMGHENNLPEVHPFLVAKSLGNSMVYYEIRETRPVFGKELLELVWVKRARALTWKHRIDVESWPSRRVFRALGAIGYSEGFDPARARKVTWINTFVEDIVSCFDNHVSGHLQEKARELGVDTSEWNAQSAQSRKLAKRALSQQTGQASADVSAAAPVACNVPRGE